LGDVCAAETPGWDERLILIVTGVCDGIVDFVPVSEEVAYATDRDLLIDAGAIGYEAMAEAWNIGSLLIEELAEKLATLDDSTWTNLCVLLDVVEHGAELPDALPVGVPIVGEKDPRWGFHVLESDRVRPFLSNAAALRGISRLPALLARKAEEAGVAVDALSERFGDWVNDLAANTINLEEQVDKSDLTALLNELRVPAIQKVVAIVACTHREGAAVRPVAEAVPARRGFLARVNRTKQPPDLSPREEAARAYAESVVGALRPLQAGGVGSSGA
jgi:hypothetical protein